jgi:hypothetical protein
MARRLRRLPCWGGALFVSVLATGCRCSEDPPQAATPALAAATVSSCVRGANQLTLSPRDTASDQAWDDVVDLPFSVEVGVGVALGGDFYVTALRSEAQGASQLLVRLGAGAAESEVIELGRVRGDAAPARIAGYASELAVALLEPETGGRKLRLGSVRREALPTSVRWSAELPQGNDESSAYDLALGDGRAVVAWDDWNAGAKQSEIHTATWALDQLDAPPQTHVVSALGHDAEAPRLALRPGGYWLAWLVTAPRASSVTPSKKPGAGVAAAPAAPDEAAGGDPLVSGERWIELLGLDAAGASVGKVVRVTTGRRVLGFDLVAGPEGQAWIVWREDAPSVLAPGGKIVLGVVVDGVTEEHAIDEEDVGAGVPSWLSADNRAVPTRAAPALRWLSFAGRGDVARVFRVRDPSAAPDSLVLGKALRDGTALAVNGQEILFATPHARSVELSVASCREGFSDAGAR